MCETASGSNGKSKLAPRGRTKVRRHADRDLNRRFELVCDLRKAGKLVKIVNMDPAPIADKVSQFMHRFVRPVDNDGRARNAEPLYNVKFKPWDNFSICACIGERFAHKGKVVGLVRVGDHRRAVSIEGCMQALVCGKQGCLVKDEQRRPEFFCKSLLMVCHR